MHLEHLFDWTAEFRTPTTVGRGPLGQRIVADILGGSFSGPRLSGKVLPSGADWALIDADGNGRLDVRIVLETDDGAFIYVSYRARMVMNDKLQAVLFEQRGASEFGDTYWISQLEFETGDERYAWLNNLMAAGEGRLAPNSVTYRVYAIEAN
ncbi:MAG: DUF3237 domain-containing protein [Desulfurellaceae bacterium]|nr:DUF3237 domain-containing protein [Desulfurellaceae bacterium]